MLFILPCEKDPCCNLRDPQYESFFALSNFSSLCFYFYLFCCSHALLKPLRRSMRNWRKSLSLPRKPSCVYVSNGRPFHPTRYCCCQDGHRRTFTQDVADILLGRRLAKPTRLAKLSANSMMRLKHLCLALALCYSVSDQNFVVPQIERLKELLSEQVCNDLLNICYDYRTSIVVPLTDRFCARVEPEHTGTGVEKVHEGGRIRVAGQRRRDHGAARSRRHP